MFEKNAGYEIIASEDYGVSRLGQRDRIVLGRRATTQGAMFVTWVCAVWPTKDGNAKVDYFWGHYFDDEAKARADYHRRLAEKYER